jgi:Ca2+-binding EF-hand superfamily protein
MARTDTDVVTSAVGLDEREFGESFRVFSSTGSSDNRSIAKTNSVLVPFLKSLGLRDNVETIVQRIKDTYPTGHSVTKEQLLEVVAPALATNWPGDEDVKRAFRVFDSEGLGFIKVTLLKRFLVQSQLGVDDAILEQLIREHCHIDGDDLINYEEFISSVRNNSLQPTC